MKYSIFTNKQTNSIDFKSRLITILNDNKHINVETNPEYIFIIGGDGTFLSLASKYIKNDIKIVFINSGTLGFYSYIDKPEKLLFEEIFNNNLYTTLDYLQVEYNSKYYNCINDFSIQSNYATRIKEYINDALLQTINSNGILLSTPFGSTGRNKSLHGPILFPETNVLALSEIEAINNKYYASLGSPIVINNNAKIKFEVEQKYNSWLLFDGEQIEIKEKNYNIIVDSYKTKAQFLIKTNDKDYARKLNYAFIKADNDKN